MEENPENQQNTQRIRVSFEGITPHAWEHPADRVGMKALKAVPGMDKVLKMFLNMFANEHAFKLFALAAAVRVNESQFPRLYELHLEACRVLDIEKVPELFVSQNPFLNAGAIGIDEPLIMLNSSILDTMTDDEILCIIGHELGHIKSEHMLYHTLFFFLKMLLDNSHRLPFPGIAVTTLLGVYYALLEWSRKSELSCDRAGLLVVQDPEIAIQLQMKFAGGKNIDQMNLGEFMKQAEEYNERGSMSDNVMKIFNIVNQTHPFSVIRVYELMEWVRSGDYENILRGYYTKHAEQPLAEDVKEATASYKKGFKQTIKPLEDMFNDIKDDVQKGATQGKNPFDIFDDWRKKNM